MPEGESQVTSERIERPWASKYLPVDFVYNAPVEEGPEGLMQWLDEHLTKAVQQEVCTRLEFWPALESLGSFVKDGVEGLMQTEVKAVSSVLWQWADYEAWLHRFKDPEVRKRQEEQFQRRLAKASDEKFRQKILRRGILTPENIRARQIGVEAVIQMLGLDREKDMLKDLFDQASSVGGETTAGKAMIEGKVIARR